VDYLFEQLDADKFQELCQALLVSEYPTVQCFPTGQPDGGRDALVRSADGTAAVVAQVKFKKSDTSGNMDWAIEALKGELPKIQRLQEQGAIQEYILLTNARGSAHLGKGAIDGVQQWLDDNVGVPARVMWRRDLAARLDRSTDLQLRYPALLTGEAALAFIMSSQYGSDRKRLDNTLRSFVAEQYKKDEEVKFREVDLANSLLSLFVDVPTDIGLLLRESNRHGSQSDEVRSAARALMQRARRAPRDGLSSVQFSHTYARAPIGTADLLLSDEAQQSLKRVLIQGAPGQGKSTLAQYVCQVHRARYLAREDFVKQLPPAHQGAAFRFPIKIDLRDAAAFFDGQEFLKHASEQMESKRTLERFLAYVIEIDAGGADFTVDDVRLVLQETPAILFLDGLDEVADLALREQLVTKVVDGIGRLQDIGADLQVVMTSRPAQIGRLPKYTSQFVRIALDPLDESTVMDYARKWALAKHLPAERSDEVVGIVEDKMSLTHIRELTKNPMQLTILLSLVLTSGNSLPDDRTDLYTKYVDTFMTREAEKSKVVRRHRALLLEVVEYLAWMLQSSAEAGRASGSISANDLHDLVREYLHRADQDERILSDVFERGVERVYVLVQRVDGFYEFEVQPLREYFAAKYLYTTAPVASFRQDHLQGDRAQRFEAIAVNPYWSNVTRFYAGFYHGGELGALQTSLEELISTSGTAEGLAARSIGALLLADRTFVSKKRIQSDVIRLVFDSVGVYLVATSALGQAETFALPEDAGRREFAQLLFDEHIRPFGGVADFFVTTLLAANGGRHLAGDFVDYIRAATGDERTDRIIVASRCGGLDDIPAEAVREVLLGDSPATWQLHDRLGTMVADDALGNRLPVDVGKILMESLIKWGGVPLVHVETDLAWLTYTLGGRLASPAVMIAEQTIQVLPAESHQRYLALREEVDALDVREGQRGGHNLGVVLTTAEMIFGHQWAVFRLALESGSRYKALALLAEAKDEDSVVNWIVNVRSSKTSATRWRGRLSAETPEERLFWLAALLGWGRVAEVDSLHGECVDAIDGLADESYVKLLLALRVIHRIRTNRGGRPRGSLNVKPSASARVFFVYSVAQGSAAKSGGVPVEPQPRILVASRKAGELRERFHQFKGWKDLGGSELDAWLKEIRDLRRAPVDLYTLLGDRRPTLLRVPRGIADRVLADVQQYPDEFVGYALETVQRSYSPTHVLRIAKASKWVFQ
jgi:hypothetical protein